MGLVDKVMSTEPCKSARRVHFVVDNGSSHNGKRSIERWSKPFRTSRRSTCRSMPPGRTRSWSSSRSPSARSLRSGDFADRGVLARRPAAPEDRCNATTSPLDWRCTTKDPAPLSSAPRPTPRPPPETSGPPQWGREGAPGVDQGQHQLPARETRPTALAGPRRRGGALPLELRLRRWPPCRRHRPEALPSPLRRHGTHLGLCDLPGEP